MTHIVHVNGQKYPYANFIKYPGIAKRVHDKFHALSYS